jgi:hypothetical protein
MTWDTECGPILRLIGSRTLDSPPPSSHSYYTTNPDSVKPRILMREFILGVALIIVWIVLQFVVQSTSGFIHIALAAGVILIIRGIAVSKWGTPDTPSP